MTERSMSFNDVAVVTFGRNDYRIHSWNMTRTEAVNGIKSFDLSQKN